ncbi:hypothetical protein QFC21_006214 [Naganishia friedmannii]|uniref:Uncharacterized protein n=1 Tax=Naganishia friedmannii TaxID=89922 RepID=A0ACC2V405_9TREE|nr:hypothetical protein QFC21_006214 [Naganishia friedmannii]
MLELLAGTITFSSDMTHSITPLTQPSGIPSSNIWDQVTAEDFRSIVERLADFLASDSDRIQNTCSELDEFLTVRSITDEHAEYNASFQFFIERDNDERPHSYHMVLRLKMYDHIHQEAYKSCSGTGVRRHACTGIV